MMPQRDIQRTKVRYSGSVDVIDSSANIIDSSLESSFLVDPKFATSNDGYTTDIRSNQSRKTLVKGGSLNNLSKKGRSKAMRKYKISFSYSCASNQIGSEINPKIINLQRLDHITTRSDHQFVSDKLKPVMTCIVQKLISEYRRSKDSPVDNDLEGRSEAHNTYTLSSSSCDNLAIAQMRSDFENETTQGSIKSSNLINFYSTHDRHTHSTNEELQSDMRQRLMTYPKPLTRCNSLSHVGIRHFSKLKPKTWKTISPSFVRDGYLFKRSKITNNLNVNIKSLIDKVTISQSFESLSNKGDSDVICMYSALNEYFNKEELQYDSILPLVSYLRNIHFSEFCLTKEFDFEKITESPIQYEILTAANIESYGDSRQPSVHGSNYSNDNENEDKNHEHNDLFPERPMSPIEATALDIQNMAKIDPTVKACKMLKNMSKVPKKDSSSPKDDDDDSSSQFSVLSTCQICLGDPVLCFESECRKSLIERYVDLLEEAEGVTVKRLPDNTIDMENLKALLYKFMEDKNAYPTEEIKEDIQRRQSIGSGFTPEGPPIYIDDDIYDDDVDDNDVEKNILRTTRNKSVTTIETTITENLYENDVNDLAERPKSVRKSVLQAPQERESHIGKMIKDNTIEMNEMEPEEYAKYSQENEEKLSNARRQRPSFSVVESSVTKIIDTTNDEWDEFDNKKDQTSMYLEDDHNSDTPKETRPSVYITETVTKTTTFENFDTNDPDDVAFVNAVLSREVPDYDDDQGNVRDNDVKMSNNKSRESILSRRVSMQRPSMKNDRFSVHRGSILLNNIEGPDERLSQFISPSKDKNNISAYNDDDVDIVDSNKNVMDPRGRRSTIERQSVHRQSTKTHTNVTDNSSKPNQAIEVDQFSTNDIIVEIDDHQPVKQRKSNAFDPNNKPVSSLNKFDDNQPERGRKSIAVGSAIRNGTPDTIQPPKQRKSSVFTGINRPSMLGNKGEGRPSMQPRKLELPDRTSKVGTPTAKVDDRQSMKPRKSNVAFDGNDEQQSIMKASQRDTLQVDNKLLEPEDGNRFSSTKSKSNYGNDGNENVPNNTTNTVHRISHVTSHVTGNIDNNGVDNVTNKPANQTSGRRSQIDTHSERHQQIFNEFGSQTDPSAKISSFEKVVQTEGNNLDTDQQKDRSVTGKDKSTQDHSDSINDRNLEIDGILNKLKMILHQSEEYLQRFPHLLHNSYDPNNDKQNGISIPKDLFVLIKNLCQKEDAGYISDNERYKNLDQSLEYICKYLNGLEHNYDINNSPRSFNDLPHSNISEGMKNDRQNVEYDNSHSSDNNVMFDKLIRCVMQKLSDCQNQLNAPMGNSGPTRAVDNDIDDKNHSPRSNNGFPRSNLADGMKNDRHNVEFDSSQSSDGNVMFDKLVQCVMQKLVESQNQLYSPQGSAGPMRCTDNDYTNDTQTHKRTKCRSNLSMSQENVSLMDNMATRPFDNQTFWNEADPYHFNNHRHHQQYKPSKPALTSPNIESIIANCLPPESKDLMNRVRNNHAKLRDMKNLNVYEEISCRMNQLLKEVKRSQARFQNSKTPSSNMRIKDLSTLSQNSGLKVPRSHSMSNINENPMCSDHETARHTVASIQNIKSSTNQSRKIKSGFRNIRKELRDKTNRAVLNKARQKMLCSAIREDNISNNAFKSKVSIKSVNKRKVSR